MSHFDLIVVGAGPAGAAAAITARRNGTSVLLLERGSFPRHKVCGEFVSAESLGLLAGLLRAEPRSAEVLEQAPQLSRARIFIDGRTLQAPVAPAAASITRFTLDELLWKAAQQEGVDARSNVNVQSIGHLEKFAVTTSAGEFTSRAVINSSGRWSNLTPRTQPAAKPNWIGLKAHFSEAVSPPSCDLYFFAGGYCGVQPIGQDAINACAMVRADAATSLEQVFELHPALAERSRSWEQLFETVSTSPLLFRPPEPIRDGMLQAGDAAGFIDPFAGDGISLALHSGALAAESLQGFLRGIETLDQGVACYQNRYRSRFAAAFRNAARLRRLLNTPSPLRRVMLLPLGSRFVMSRIVRMTRAKQ